jgi:hypothetical protein
MANILSRIIATFDLANRVRVLNPCANIDSQYGPYVSVEEAKTTLAGVLNENSVGRTIGITEADGKVTEYWWQTITDSNGNKTYDFVLKQYVDLDDVEVTRIPSDDIDALFDDDLDNPTIDTDYATE